MGIESAGDVKMDNFDLRSIDPLIVLNTSIYVQIVLSILLLIMSFIVANTANMTLILFTTVSTFISYPLWAYYALHRFPSHVTIGATLGSGLVIVFISLQTAVFWGNLSVCEKVSMSIQQYSCNSRVAYRIICILSICIFLTQFLFVILLAQFRLIVLKDAEEYEEIFAPDEQV